MLVSIIADKFKLVGIPYKVSQNVKNKYAFREVCSSMSLPTTGCKLLSNLGDIDKVNKGLKFPLVVKPIYGASSAFVVKVENKNKLKKIYKYVKKNISSFWLAAEWKNFKIVAEEYIKGKEVDIDILIQNGEIKYYTVNDNKETQEPYFVEVGQWSPSILPNKKQDDLFLMARDCLKQIGVTDGCIHFEAKSTEQGPVPIEINLRMGGNHVYYFSKYVWGVDLVENAVLIALGINIKINKPKKPLNYLVGGQFLSNTSGIITNIEVDKRLFKQPYFMLLYFEKEMGEIFLSPPNGYDASIGRLLVSSKKSIKEAMKNLEKGRKFIRYSIEPLKGKKIL